MDTQAFYDELSEDYHLIYADRAASMGRQAAALGRVIEEALGEGPKSILDCTCGIGTQTLGLAQLGHEVTGTDLSPRSIERARREARDLGVSVRFEVADVRVLDEAVAGPFDVVLSADNALPHLPSASDLQKAVRAMLWMVRPGGLLLVSIRDYDRLIEEKPTSTPVVTTGPEGERRIVFQLWTWAADGRSYGMELFILKEGPEGWAARSHRARYRAVRRSELIEIVKGNGCASARWLMPRESGFFQPLLVATAPPAEGVLA